MTDDYSDERPKKSIDRVIFVDGLLIRGGFFALWTIVGGFCIDWFFGSAEPFLDYVSSRATWTHFVFYFLLFGLFIGLDQWFSYKGGKVESFKIT